jgi:DNA-binding transcriptional LysR family regulator
MTNRDIIKFDAKLLAAFCAAAEELHFGKAADRMFMSQPPFSQLIKRLESQVGTPLFVRTTRSVQLTPAGQVMHQQATKLLSDTQAMLRLVRLAAAGEAGSLSIGLTPTAACSPLAEALYRYRRAHPDIELDLREMNSNEMQAALRRKSIDVALMRPYRIEPDIEAVEVLSEPMLLAVRKDDPLAALKRISVKRISAIPLVGYDARVSPYFHELLDALLAHAGSSGHIVLESLVPTILTFVEAGVGAAVVARTMSKSRGQSLAFIPIAESSRFPASIVVASLRRRHHPAVEGFVKSLRG